MNTRKEIKNHSRQVRDRDKNRYKRKSHSERINRGPTQYLEETTTNNYVNKTNLQRCDFRKRLNKKE